MKYRTWQKSLRRLIAAVYRDTATRWPEMYRPLTREEVRQIVKAVVEEVGPRITRKPTRLHWSAKDGGVWSHKLHMSIE